MRLGSEDSWNMEKRSQYWLSVLYIRVNDGLKGCNVDWTCFGDRHVAYHVYCLVLTV
jgi:hypothetical protein